MLFRILFSNVINVIKVSSIVLIFSVNCRFDVVLDVVVLMMLVGWLFLVISVVVLILLWVFLVFGIISLVNNNLSGVVIKEVVIRYFNGIFICV